MLTSILTMLLLGCPTPSAPSSLRASDIGYNDQNVAIALANLEAQLMIQAKEQVDGEKNDSLQEISDIKKDIGILQEELVHIRTLLEQVQEGGIAHAKLIPFDPRVTTLKAQTLQDAMDEMMQRVTVLERHVLDDRGEPGPGLFEIPKDKKGNGPGGPPPNGQGQNAGPNNEPNGGGPNGGPNGGGPNGGKNQKGPGKP